MLLVKKMQGVASRVVALIALALALLVPAAARAGQTWLIVSDIHLDPFDTGSRPSRAGNDANLALFESMLAEMKRSVPDPAVVLIPGDLLAHRFAALVNQHDAGSATAGVALQTMRHIAARFAQTYPKARFAMVLGNNDDPCGDYKSSVGGPYMEALAQVWAPLVDRGGAAPGFERSFASGGYYTAALPLAGFRLIALNTTYFSKEYLGDCNGPQPAAAPRELAWLNSTLASTQAGTHDVLLMHIPPGYDAFATEAARGIVAWPYYGDDSDAGLLEAMVANGDRLAFAIAGHSHRFDFRLVPASHPVPIFVFGALSPIYGNNPNFTTIDVTPNGRVHDLSFYVYDEKDGNWQPARSFDAAWKLESPDIDAAGLAALHQGLGDVPAMRVPWDEQSSAWGANSRNVRILWADGWRMAWCAQSDLGPTYAACAHTGDPQAWLRLAIWVFPIVALVAVLVIVIRRRLSL
jgi:hypothetical protein